MCFIYKNLSTQYSIYHQLVDKYFCIRMSRFMVHELFKTIIKYWEGVPCAKPSVCVWNIIQGEVLDGEASYTYIWLQSHVQFHTLTCDALRVKSNRKLIVSVTIMLFQYWVKLHYFLYIWTDGRTSGREVYPHPFLKHTDLTFLQFNVSHNTVSCHAVPNFILKIFNKSVMLIYVWRMNTLWMLEDPDGLLLG